MCLVQNAESIFDEPTENSARDIRDLFMMAPDLQNCHDPTSYEAQQLQKVARKINQKRKMMQKALQAKLEEAHAESNQKDMVKSAHLLVKYFDPDKTYTEYLARCCPLVNDANCSYSKTTEFIQQGVVRPQEVFDMHVHDVIFKGPLSIDNEYQLIRRIFPEPSQVMKRLVTDLFGKRIQRFVDAMKAACGDQKILDMMECRKTVDKALLDLLDVAHSSILDIENKLIRYDLADLDVHSLTLKLFPELKGVSTGEHEQDYIEREMQNLTVTLETLRLVSPHICITVGSSLLSALALAVRST